MNKKAEAVTPPQTISRVLDVAGEELILIGGQALAFWVQRFDLVQASRAIPAITNDMDFLSVSVNGRAAVRRLAGAIRGKVLYPNKRALTALVGQAYLEISEEEYINIDVLWKLIGPTSAKVKERAILVRQPGEHPPFLVMHPLDVLHSRLINLHKLPDKQNDKGRMQLALAIDVARAFLQDEASRIDPAAVAMGRSPLQDYVSAIEHMAVVDAGRKVVTRHQLHVADAIDPTLIPAGPFWTKRWPTLKGLMSPAYAARFRPPLAPEASAS